MNKHEHIECPHELEYCRKCDIVYCLKCSKEWKAQLTYSIYPNTIYSYDIDSSDFFSQEGATIDKIAKDIASTIVSGILENFEWRLIIILSF